MRRLILAGALALGLSGCAAFQAAPSAASCSQAQALLSGATLAETAINASLVAAQANGANATTVTRIQGDLGVAQAARPVLQAAVTAKCATPIGVAVSTPVVSAAVHLGG